MIQTVNQNPLSAADPTSLQNPSSKKKGISQANERSGFKSNLDDQLAQAGGIEGAQANLAALLAAQSQGQSIQKPVSSDAQNLALALQLMQQQQKGLGVERPGKQLGMQMDPAELMPATQKVASSVNAGSTIAGLKPWDHEWVFQGNPNPETAQEVRPLIGPSNTETEMAELQQALAQIRGLVPNQVNPGAAQVSPNLRSRGDQDIADLSAIEASPAERMQMAQIAGAVTGNLGQQLHSQIRAMNGQMTEVNGSEQAKTGPAARKVAIVNGQLVGGSGLSGAEFMNTLNVVRPNQLSGGDQSMEQDAQSGGFGGNPQMAGLKVFEGAKNGRDAYTGDDFVMASPAALHSQFQPNVQAQSQQQPVVQLNGQVVPGAGAQDQLAHDAILNMSTGIRNMSATGGGEMRIRLKPENLGELHLRVVSQNGEIGIHIQASDEKAKKILQDSLGSLKNGLAAQNLTLGKVAIEVASAGAGHDMRNDSHHQSFDRHGQHQQHQAQQFNLEQNANGNRNQREALWSDPESPAVAARPLKSTAAAAMSGSNSNSRASDGRLDVMA